MITLLNPNDFATRFRNFITFNSTKRLQLKHDNKDLDIRVERAP